MMIHAKVVQEPKLLETYETLGLQWTKEMYGYNFACAQAAVNRSMIILLREKTN